MKWLWASYQMGVWTDLFTENLNQDEFRDKIWEYRPGKRIFLVLNQSYLDERSGLVLKQMDTTLKLSSIFRW